MYTIEDLLNNLRFAKTSVSSENISPLSGEAARAAIGAHNSINRTLEKIFHDVKPSSAEAEYVHKMNFLCGIPINDTASQLRADVRSNKRAQPDYYQSEFGKLALFATATQEAWCRRTTHAPVNIEHELSRYDFGQTLIASKYSEAKDKSHLLEDFIHGAQINTVVMSYILNVHEKLISQPPDWSPLGEYFPDKDDWIVSNIGKKKEIREVKGGLRLAAGLVAKATAKIVFGLVVPGASVLFLNPTDYISDFMPTGVLSVSEKETLDMAALRVSGAMGKNEKAQVVMDCVYAGRILSHPKYIQHTLKDVAMKANNARNANQFAAECFVVNLRDDRDGRFAKFVREFKQPNYSVYAYDYPRKSNNDTGTLIYNNDDWKTAQFAGWFDPNGAVTKFKDLLKPDGKEGGVSYIHIKSLKDKFSGCDADKLLNLVKVKYPAAELLDEDIILYGERR